MVTVRIYIEGGGEGKELDEVFRRAWKRFFEAAGVRRKPRVIRGGGRQHTFVAFRNRAARDTVEETSLLLVDSEGAVRSDVWEHLRIRDGWVRPAGTDDRQAFLMVQVMETWFLADVDTLQRFFGASFRPSALREWPQLEQVPKQTALDALAQASGRRYTKRKGFDLLEQIRPDLVETACPHAKALLSHLRSF